MATAPTPSQLLIPGNTFYTSRIIGRRRWFLGASTEWPGVLSTEDVELGDAESLAEKYPDVAAEIRSFPGAGRPIAAILCSPPLSSRSSRQRPIRCRSVRERY